MKNVASARIGAAPQQNPTSIIRFHTGSAGGRAMKDFEAVELTRKDAIAV